MSRENAKKYSYKTDIDRCVIISINDVSDEANKLNRNNNITAVCPLFFDDVECNQQNHMSREDADKIIQFVNTHLNNVDEIIVHCGAGVSRSAGVCAALMLILTGDDSAIFNCGKYRPNMHCYRLVLESYFGYYNKEPIDKRLRENIIEWRKSNLIAE
jgi:protein-tyrosine phosphatase